MGADDEAVIVPLDVALAGGTVPSDDLTHIDAGRWWPLVAVAAAIVAVVAVLGSDGTPRPLVQPAPAVPVTTVAAAIESVVEPLPGPASVPVLGRTWASELVFLQERERLIFVDLDRASTRSIDLAVELDPPIVFEEGTAITVQSGALLSGSPGFSGQQILRNGTRTDAALPGSPATFYDADALRFGESVEVMSLLDGIASTIWLPAGARPWAMWDGTVLAQRENRIELYAFDGTAPVPVVAGTILAASGGALYQQRCEPGAPCHDVVVFAAPRGAEVEVDPSVRPDRARVVSLGPLGRSAVFEVPGPDAAGTVTRVVELGSGEVVGETATPAGARPPSWSPDGSAVLIDGAEGLVLVDLWFERSGLLSALVGDVPGRPLGFVTTRVLAP